MVSVLLVIPFRPFSACYSSAGLPTYIRPGNVSEYSLIRDKCIGIPFRYTENRLYILVNLERVCTLILGTIYPPLYTLHPERARNYLLPYIDTLWIRLGDGLVNGAKSSLEQLRTSTAYKPRLDTHLNG